ncbi:MAG: hypothetical protein HQM10_22330 [Candidatus Riflebacteria bacterium]|nr:hypothetical protein [Candidatus Riflebacteria bacterium]
MPEITNTKSGMTLIEIIVSSVLFLVIYMGMASLLRSSMFFDKTVHSVATADNQFREGMRLLLEGDDCLTNPQTGLLRASRAWILANGNLQYRDGLTGRIFQVWIQNGCLMRQEGALAAKMLMGDALYSPLNAPRTMLSPYTTSAAVPMAVLPQGNGTVNSVVRFNFSIFQDYNGDQIPNDNEIEIRFTPSVFLRGSET